MMINWKVRIKNRTFWLTAIPALLLLVKQVLNVFGIHFDDGAIGGQLTEIVSTVFLLLTLLGIVNDPTTATLGDSKQAMDYEFPKWN